MMTATFTMLGTGGWIPTARRATTCCLLSMPEALFIFDAGTGLARLLEGEFRRELEPPAREVHLFLSHYHLDHVCGLVYLAAMFRGRGLYLHPPGADITGLDPLETIDALVRKPFNPGTLAEMPLDISVEPLGAGSHRIAGLQVKARQQLHPDASAAWRVADLMVFATDTAADPATAAFARGARLLVHEAWIDGAEEDDPGTAHVAREAYVAHTSARQAAALAVEAGVERLVLSHLNPVRSPEYHSRMLDTARAVFPATAILEDGERITV
ncbi:MAG: MBL fold metallo-hydrolase [Thermoleophilia bacterium]